MPAAVISVAAPPLILIFDFSLGLNL